MFKFNIIPASQLPQKQPANSKVQLTLDEKFELYKREAIKKHSGRSLRKFHFIAFEHEGFLFVMNGEMKIFAKLENPGSLKTSRDARVIYAEVIAGNENTEGGCYFDEF